MTSPPSNKSKNNSYIAVFALLVFLCAIAVSSLYINNKNQTILETKQQTQADAEKEKNEKERKELQSLFDNYLNDFTTELREKATEYKDTRSVLKDIKSPYNFETPEYAKENYNLFKKSIAPSLRQKASKIIGVFDIYNKKIKANLKNKNNDLQQTFRKKWKEMNKTQLTKYVAFFSKEEDIIQAYDDLITFYYAHSRLYKVDTEANEFIFSRKKDEKEATKLLDRVNELQNGSKKQK